MESPPSSCTWSEAFIISEDSGLLLTNSSISSGSMSGDFHNNRRLFVEDSDCDDKSLSQDDSLDGMSDVICGEHFNTLKKGAHWTDISVKHSSPIEPPPEFQDKPFSPLLDWYCNNLSVQILMQAFREYKDSGLRTVKIIQKPMHLLNRHYWTPDFIPFSPCHAATAGRPNSRSSLGSSRLSSSHNSLSYPTAMKVDDSSFITQAVSHDTLSSNQISDLYNVPFDSDVYAVPIDVVKSPMKPKKVPVYPKKRRRNTSASGSCRDLQVGRCCLSIPKKSENKYDPGVYWYKTDSKRHSVAGTSANIEATTERESMTLDEVRTYLQTLYSSSSDSSESKKIYKQKTATNNNNKYTEYTTTPNPDISKNNLTLTNSNRAKKTFLINIKNKKVKDSCDTNANRKEIVVTPVRQKTEKEKKATVRFSFRQALCNIFKFRRFTHSHSSNKKANGRLENTTASCDNLTIHMHSNIVSRALPPLPTKEYEVLVEDGEHALDFATSIQKVKDCGWYWGPLSGTVAEKILSNEPDGSFIVRDSSDDHYIFSLTFKLNDCVRHVRIEHDQGNFSFGSCTKFKSQTIVEFIENAVEHSRSGRYLFFLHRRPVIGPVRVQLLHPVSRFKQVQSLQHMCRFVIHKVVRRDLIPNLPLPRRMIDYLNTPHYYSEHFVDIEENIPEQTYPSNITQEPETIPPQEQEQPLPNVPGNYYGVLNNQETIHR